MNNQYARRLFTAMPAILFTAFVLATGLSYADDAPLEMKTIGGSECLMGNSNTEVRLDSELVVITLNKNSYTVDAVFWLFNEGAEITTDIGFPKEYKYYFNAESDIWNVGKNKKGKFDINIIKKKQEFDKFETWVNGKKVKYQALGGQINFTFASNDGLVNYRIGPDEKSRLIEWLSKCYKDFRENDSWDLADSMKYTIKTTEGKSFTLSYNDISNKLNIIDLDWLTKNVTLPAGKATTTRVKYTCKYPSSYYDPIWKYIYGTGRNWKGKIGKAAFVIIDKYEITKKITAGVLSNDQLPIDRKPVINKTNGKTEVILLDFEPEDMENIEGRISE